MATVFLAIHTDIDYNEQTVLAVCTTLDKAKAACLDPDVPIKGWEQLNWARAPLVGHDYINHWHTFSSLEVHDGDVCYDICEIALDSMNGRSV